jgi:hypothetical protein
MDSFGSGYGPVAGSYEDINEVPQQVDNETIARLN